MFAEMGVPINVCEIHCLPLLVNGIGEDVSVTVMMGKVIRPLRSVDPSQTEYQGLIEVTEEGLCQVMSGITELMFKVYCLHI